ncbi:MAG: DUF3883 domain-containing protein [Blastomonas sp.]
MLRGKGMTLVDVWSDSEIDLAVADYFAMLAEELSGMAVNKAARYRALADLIPRSAKSVERKYQNISAVMIGFGQPWITGLKPARHYQLALEDGVQRWLDAQPGWLKPNRSAGVAQVVADTPRLWIGPPPTHRNEPPPVDPRLMAAVAMKYDIAGRDERNRALGRAGEEVVLHHERATLADAGRHDLAAEVRWISDQDGDGLGFDIASFEPDGRERLIEVKTTNGWERTPFHISRNELAVSRERRDDWHLIRVYNFARRPSAFALRPPLESYVELTATSYSARFV